MPKHPFTSSVRNVAALFLAVMVPMVALAQVPFDPSSMGGPEPLSGAHPFFEWTTHGYSWEFIARLVINLVGMILLIRFVYYRVTRRHDFFFTFYMFNLVIFIITTLLNSASGFSIGAAFGLFAIFALLRYRTEDIPPRDMTYLFLSITLGLISSINQGSILEIIIVNGIIIAAAFLIEGNVLLKPEFVKTVEYENIELIRPDRREDMLEDLRLRTGLDIHKVDIRRIDFLRDTAVVKIYYRGRYD